MVIDLRVRLSYGPNLPGITSNDLFSTFIEKKNTSPDPTEGTIHSENVCELGLCPYASGLAAYNRLT